MKKLEKLKKFEMTNTGSIWGGKDCNKYTQHTDYTTTPSGACQADETCWVCDDVVASVSTASSK